MRPANGMFSLKTMLKEDYLRSLILRARSCGRVGYIRVLFWLVFNRNI